MESTRRGSFGKVVVLAAAFALIPALSAFSQSFFGKAQAFLGNPSWAFRASVLLIPEDNGLQSDPMPVLFSPGVAAVYPLLSALSLEVSLDWYGTYYDYSDALGRAVPAAIENRSAFVFGTVLGAQALTRIPLPKDLSLRLFGGLSADLRLCLTADGLEGADLSAASTATGKVASYFWGGGRWLLPVLGAGLDFPASKLFLLGLDVRVWVPAYRLWTGENLPAVEGWRFAAGLRVSIR